MPGELWIFPGNGLKGGGVGMQRPEAWVKLRRMKGQALLPRRPPHQSSPTSALVGEERQAPPGEVSWKSVPQEGRGSYEEVWQRSHRSRALYRVR